MKFSRSLVLQVAAWITEEEGYIPVSSGDECTAVQVTDILMDPKELDSIKSELESVKSRADDAYHWIMDVSTEKTEYLDKLRSILKSEQIPEEKVGIVSSLFSSYDRYLKRQKELEEDRKSEYYGEVNSPCTAPVTSYRLLKNGKNKYGKEFYLYKILTGKDVLIWFASTKSDSILSGNISFNVLVHEERDGVKQTVITRVSRA